MFFRYGIVVGLEAQVDGSSKYGERFLARVDSSSSVMNADKQSSSTGTPLVAIQKGQISFFTDEIKENSAENLKNHSDFFKFIEEIYQGSVDADTCNKWMFVDYIRQETDRQTLKNLVAKQLEKIMGWIYGEAVATTPSSSSNADTDYFEQELSKIRDNSLMHIYQDMYDEGTGIKLFYKKRLVHDFRSNKGRSITIGCIIDTIKTFFKKEGESEKPRTTDDIKEIFVEFFNFNTYTEERQPLFKMICDQISLNQESNGEVKPFFQQNGFWYSVSYDTIRETHVKLLDVMKKIEKTDQLDEQGSIELLEWNTRASKTEVAQFSMNELIQHCAMKNEINDEIMCNLADKLADILTTDGNRLFSDEPEESDFLVTSSTIPNGSQSLDINVSIMPETKLFDRFPASFKTEKGKKIKQSVINILKSGGPVQQRLTAIMTESKCTPDDIEIFFDKFKEPFKILRRVSNRKDEKVRFVVDNPYLTKFHCKKIESIGNGDQQTRICPGRLIQFLRMKTYLKEESDYNELYHLSNCPCHSNGWLYVVGDRILNAENDSVELFDVLCYQEKERDDTTPR